MFSVTTCSLLLILLLQVTNGKLDQGKGDMHFDRHKPDYETVMSLKEVRERSKIRGEKIHGDFTAMQTPDMFEGDMQHITYDTLPVFLDSSMELKHTKHYNLWPGGIVPFTVSSRYTKKGRQALAEALAEFPRVSCIQFVPRRQSDVNYVHIWPGYGCYSSVGMIGGRQNVSLGGGCLSKGIILHQLMHILGFFHEQRRRDRDEFINVQWRYVRENMLDSLKKYSVDKLDGLGLPYDLQSLMHLGTHAFSQSPSATLVTRKGTVVPGQLNGFSRLDVARINLLYNCPKYRRPAEAMYFR